MTGALSPSVSDVRVLIGIARHLQPQTAKIPLLSGRSGFADRPM